MSDTDETKRPAKTLSLKKTETSTVKQSFSHGRTKAVVVEKKRSAAPPAAKPAPVKAAEKPAAEKAAPVAAPAAAKPAAPARGVVLRQLSDEEKARRATALADARVSDSEARRIAEQEAERRAREEEQLKAEHIAAEKRKTEEEARKAADELAKKRAEQEAARRLEAAKTGEVVPGEAPRRRLENEEEEEGGAKKIGGKLVPAKAPAPKKAEGERRRGKLTVTRALSDDDERVRSVASYKRHLQRVNKGH
ncbi:MAG TPA: translation initiation factor IF-2 associated domain-containing protein, partial [Rhizomicrobium sp.]|nr:translation initiation factor IF-2 associated domain-containing protein [Rhizomicrobium sp.]